MGVLGIFLCALRPQLQLPGSRDVLGKAEPRIVKVAGLVAGGRRGTADGKFLYEDLGIVECSHLPRHAGRPLPVAPRACDLRIRSLSFRNQRIDADQIFLQIRCNLGADARRGYENREHNPSYVLTEGITILNVKPHLCLPIVLVAAESVRSPMKI
jgi:hypothetical protein